MDLYQLSEIEILALTLWGEARGEDIEGQVAVGSVIRNRIDKNTYHEICLKPNQFSCWNANDPNVAQLNEMAEMLLMGQIITNPDYQQVLWVATGIINNVIKDNTQGAKNYLTNTLFNSDNRPHWAKFLRTTPKIIGNQTFFNV